MIAELIGRYILTGIILWGALFVMLVVRLVSLGFKSGDPLGFIYRFGNIAMDSKVKKRSKIQKVFRFLVVFVIWPCGLVAMVHEYIQVEIRTIESYE